MANPADLCLVRMQSDGVLNVAQRRNYKHFWHAMSEVIKSEGITGLWHGSAPTIIRAMALNLGMLGSYDQIKEMLDECNSGNKVNKIAASASAGLLAALLSMPFDNVKTKIQRMAPGVDGRMPYRGMVD